jgi:hypothetical protein
VCDRRRDPAVAPRRPDHDQLGLPLFRLRDNGSGRVTRVHDAGTDAHAVAVADRGGPLEQEVRRVFLGIHVGVQRQEWWYLDHAHGCDSRAAVGGKTARHVHRALGFDVGGDRNEHFPDRVHGVDAIPAALEAVLSVRARSEDDYDGELPAFGHPEETEAMLDALAPSDGVELLRGIAVRRPEVEGQALHGDAHRFNCLGSPRGPLWHDFETACHGPREYDLAALKGDAALAAYGPYDSDLLDAMFPLYLAWIRHR